MHPRLHPPFGDRDTRTMLCHETKRNETKRNETSSDTLFWPCPSYIAKLSEGHEASDHRRAEEAELRPLSAAEKREWVVARRHALLLQVEEQHKLQGVARAARERLDERLRLGTSRSLSAGPAYLCKQFPHRIPHSSESVISSGQRTRRPSEHQGGSLRGRRGGDSRSSEQVHEVGTEEDPPVAALQCGGDATAAGECSICLEGFAEGHMSMRLACQHRFHTDCVTPWLRRRNSCPYCRAPHLLHTPSLRQRVGC